MSIVNDTLGGGGRYRDPLWRVEIELTPLEQELLSSWWVRRLAFVAHAGAASIISTQTYSRLEHSLGLLALVVHFSPDDHGARAAALLHDVGHLPFSHTFEGVGGLDHHRLGADRIATLTPILARHGLTSAAVVDVLEGRRRSALHGTGGTGGLRLDHLESFVRSGRAHGRTRQPPSVTLQRLGLIDGTVDTDAQTADYLAELIMGEARWQSSEANVVMTAVMRRLAELAVDGISDTRIAEIAAMTDHDFWALILTHPETAGPAEHLRRDPTSWLLLPADRADGDTRVGDFAFELSRLYLDLPLVGGRPMPADPARLEGLPRLPRRYVIRRRAA